MTTKALCLEASTGFALTCTVQADHSAGGNELDDVIVNCQLQNSDPPEKLLQGRGDFGDEQGLAFRAGEGIPYIPGVLIDRETVFVVDDGGVVTTVDADTGRPIHKARLKKGNGQ